MDASMQRRMRGAVLAPILVVLSTLTAGAQSDSRKLVAGRIVDQYAVIKTVIEPRRDIYVSEDGLKDNKYNLADCGGLAGNLGLLDSTDPATSVLSHTAALYYMWMTDLPKIGYPQQSVAPLIKNYENTLLNLVISKGAGNLTYDTFHREGIKLAKNINDLRSRQHLKAKQVEYTDECGGEGPEIKFIIPNGAHMYMISVFFYELCQKQNINPSDRVACNRYTEVSSGTTNQYSGLYNYVGEWSDGYTRTGQIDAASIGSENGGRVFRLIK